MVTVVTLVAVVIVVSASVGFSDLYSYSGRITLVALVIVVTEP